MFREPMFSEPTPREPVLEEPEDVGTDERVPLFAPVNGRDPLGFAFCVEDC
jgi:hypothetical protein